MRRVLLVSLTLALAAVPTVSARAANRWIEPRAPLNIAHQGGEDEFPSNTMYAYRKAMRAGADMLELDVGVTRDGKVSTTPRSTGRRTATGPSRRRR